MELYPNRQFGFIDDPDRQSGSSSVPTRTRTRSHCPDPLLTLIVGYLNGTINRKPERQNKRLEPTGVAKPGITRGLKRMGSGLAS
jgi:hypothetical protein